MDENNVPTERELLHICDIESPVHCPPSSMLQEEDVSVAGVSTVNRMIRSTTSPIITRGKLEVVGEWEQPHHFELLLVG